MYAYNVTPVYRQEMTRRTCHRKGKKTAGWRMKERKSMMTELNPVWEKALKAERRIEQRGYYKSRNRLKSIGTDWTLKLTGYH